MFSKNENIKEYIMLLKPHLELLPKIFKKSQPKNNF